MADFNLRALVVTEGENFTATSVGEGEAALRFGPVAADGSYNVKVKVVTDASEANMAAFFTSPSYSGDVLVDALGGNILVDDSGNALIAS